MFDRLSGLYPTDFWLGVLSHFFYHSSIDANQFKQEDATAFV